MLVEVGEIKYKTTCFLLFWKLPRIYIIPQSPPGHIYILLQEYKWMNSSRPAISYFPEIQDVIDQEAFSKLYKMSILAVRTNICVQICLILSYLFLVLAIFLIPIFFSVESIVSGIIVSLFAFAAMVCIRFCNVLRQRGMQRKEFKLSQVLKENAQGILEGSGYMAKAGKLGLWIDFYVGNYYQPVEI